MKTAIKQTYLIFFGACITLMVFSAFKFSKKQASVTVIVKEGKSAYSILVPNNASQPLLVAAHELQNDIAKSSGVELPLIKVQDFVSGAFISLGATPQAEAVGIHVNDIGLEGFRILTRNGNVYIAGPDTPDGQTTSTGGRSNGTSNGVYTFLEDYLGVRWLMPGEIGRDVPQHSTFELQDLNRTEIPAFFSRKMPFMQNREPAVGLWEVHQKLGASVNVNQHPTWRQNVPDSMFATHPEWFPLINGKRTVDMHNYKIETTNPELVKHFAENAIRSLKTRPQQYIISISASDFPDGWSESEESKALYDEKRWGYQMTTTLMLKFYHDIADIMAKEYPQGRLSGYIYDVYKSQPTNPEGKKYLPLPVNFYPTFANNADYGYRLYQENNRKLMEELVSFWTKQSPQLTYYGIPNRHDNTSGVILPPAVGLLNYSFSILRKYPVKGVVMYGNTSWSEGALGNYIIAKMMWNPKLDASQLQKEWLVRAYGTKAGDSMNNLYNELDDWYNAYYQTKPTGYLYHLSDNLLKNVFAKHYSELQNEVLQAKQELETPQQKMRFQLLEDNLILLQATLREKKMLEEDFKSPLQRTNDEIQQILKKANADFQFFPKRVP